MRTLAVFLPNWIGDAVMATPAVRGLRTHFPAAKIIAVAKPAVRDALGGCPWFADVIPFDRNGPPPARFRAALARLASHTPDTAVLFPNSARPALLARLAGCSRVVGFARYFRDFLLTDRLYPARGRDQKPKPVPVIDDYNRVVRKLGVPDPGHEMQLFTTPADDAAAGQVWGVNRFDRFRGVVGLNPGGAFGAAKHWPVEHFADAARTFADRGFGVLVLCGPAEREVADRIASLAARPGVVASLGDAPLSLGLSKACVRRMALLVTTDSGPRHFAAAFGVPVVTLFGPTHVEWTETYFAKATHLQLKLPCGPCQQRTCPEGHHRCMTDLSPGAVSAAGFSLISPPGTEARRAG